MRINKVLAEALVHIAEGNDWRLDSSIIESAAETARAGLENYIAYLREQLEDEILDAELVRIGLDAPPDSTAYKLARQYVDDLKTHYRDSAYTFDT